eukprot:1485066-Rhodomonas_salina.1
MDFGRGWEDCVGERGLRIARCQYHAGHHPSRTQPVPARLPLYGSRTTQECYNTNRKLTVLQRPLLYWEKGVGCYYKGRCGTEKCGVDLCRKGYHCTGKHE